MGRHTLVLGPYAPKGRSLHKRNVVQAERKTSLRLSEASEEEIVGSNVIVSPIVWKTYSVLSSVTPVTGFHRVVPVSSSSSTRLGRTVSRLSGSSPRTSPTTQAGSCWPALSPPPTGAKPVPSSSSSPARRWDLFFIKRHPRTVSLATNFVLGLSGQRRAPFQGYF